MTDITRFPGGLTNRGLGEGIGAYLPFPDPTKYVVDWDDFIYFNEATGIEYTVTVVGTGTVVATDGHGGLVLITNSAADNDSVFVQRIEESFRWSSSKKLWFETRFQVSDATQSDVMVGLAITDATPLDASDGIFFLKADGSTTINLILRKNSTDTSVGAITLANATNYKLGFDYDGANTWRVWQDGLVVASYTGTTNVPDDEDLSVVFGIMNGEAVAKTMTIDYCMAVEDR